MLIEPSASIYSRTNNESSASNEISILHSINHSPVTTCGQVTDE